VKKGCRLGQRAIDFPYVMISYRHHSIEGTHNLLCAIVESQLDIHVVHLGTMGVYGYGTSGGKLRVFRFDVQTARADYDVALDIFHSCLGV
jgi:nucleoside-diphosphate-sugar epimerase